MAVTLLRTDKALEPQHEPNPRWLVKGLPKDQSLSLTVNLDHKPKPELQCSLWAHEFVPCEATDNPDSLPWRPVVLAMLEEIAVALRGGESDEKTVLAMLCDGVARIERSGSDLVELCFGGMRYFVMDGDWSRTLDVIGRERIAVALGRSGA